MHGNLTGDSEALKQGTEKIKELRSFYALTDEFPVWPFDTQTFRRYLLTVSTPFIAPAAGLIQQLLKAIFQQWSIPLG